MRRECRERFPRHQLQRKPLVSDAGMHHGTCVTHVPWCKSGSLTSGGGENVPGFPGACATRNFTYLARGPWQSIPVAHSLPHAFSHHEWQLPCVFTLQVPLDFMGFRRSFWMSSLFPQTVKEPLKDKLKWKHVQSFSQPLCLLITWHSLLLGHMQAH